MMTPSAVEIPSEIADELIHLCALDKPALKTFSLVCKSWLPASRYHLYATATIYPWNYLTFLELFQSPFCTIKHFICRLEIEDLSNIPIQIFSIPTGLDAVRALRLGNVNWSTLGSGAKERICSCFRSVRELALSRIEFVKFDDFLEIIGSFPALEHVSLSKINYEGHRRPIARKVHNFVPHHAMPPLHTVVLESLLPAEVLWISRFLQMLGASLRHLTLEVGELFENAAEALSKCIDMSCNTQLRSIRIVNLDLSRSSNLCIVYVAELDLRTSCVGCLSVRWVTALLRQVVSEHMESIEFTIKSDVAADLERLEWDELVQVFTLPHWKVLFSINCFDAEGAKHLISERLRGYDVKLAFS